MEFLAGGTVADALRVDSVRRVHAVKWLQEAASALDFAHGRGVLHRDIKPANLLLDRDRTLHVADFGIARLGAEDTITGTGQVLGTASYLAPERALGRPATAASDRYSLAVAAFELLVGERPFTARHFAAQARQHVEEEPPAASELNRTLPTSVDAVLARGMAKRPERAVADRAGFRPGARDRTHRGGDEAPPPIRRRRRLAPRDPRRTAAVGATAARPPAGTDPHRRGAAHGAADRVAAAGCRAPASAPSRADPGARRACPRSRRSGGDRRHDRKRWTLGAAIGERSAAGVRGHPQPPAGAAQARHPEAADDSDRHCHRQPPRRRLRRRPRRSRRAGTS